VEGVWRRRRRRGGWRARTDAKAAGSGASPSPPPRPSTAPVLVVEEEEEELASRGGGEAAASEGDPVLLPPAALCDPLDAVEAPRAGGEAIRRRKPVALRSSACVVGVRRGDACVLCVCVCCGPLSRERSLICMYV